MLDLTLTEAIAQALAQFKALILSLTLGDLLIALGVVVGYRVLLIAYRFFKVLQFRKNIKEGDEAGFRNLFGTFSFGEVKAIEDGKARIVIKTSFSTSSGWYDIDILYPRVKWLRK